MSNQGMYGRWLELKIQEDNLRAERAALEERMAEGIPEDWEGSKTWDDGPFKVKATRRMNRKVDAETLVTVADDKGLNEYLEILFRWKPEIKAKEWRETAPEVRGAFEPAIVTTPGKVGFTIEKAEGR